jgi:type 1 glutamine amidotransferase
MVMTARRHFAVGIAALLALVFPSAADSAQGPVAASAKPLKLLVYTRTQTFRHTSIDAAVPALEALGSQNGFTIDHTEDHAAFTDDNLARYDAVMFVLTTGDVLGPNEQQALRRYMRRGGGYAGVHSASDTEHGWPWYGRLVGAYFKVHPLAYSAATFTNEAPRNTSTKHFPASFEIHDEHYSFDHSPRGEVRVLLSIDEGSYTVNPNTSLLAGQVVDGHMGDHPMSWCHRNVGGPSWYTAIGHSDYLWSEPYFLQHLLGGIRIATGVARSPCRSG